jgi:hypothetical protein
MRKVSAQARIGRAKPVRQGFPPACQMSKAKAPYLWA